MNLPPLIAALLSPEAYPERSRDVTILQTHISYVFLLSDFVYKIKKPVDFGFLDFTTIDRRRFYCEEELRLNRRLAPEIYLGVVPVVMKDGRPKVGGAGEPVEYAVKMRRIRDDALLYHAIRNNTITPDTIKKIARAIAGFHKKAATDERIAPYGAREMIAENVAENFTQTAQLVGRIILRESYEGIKAYAEGFIDANAGLLAERVASGHIRDCHGDIHSEHVSVADGIEIIDCIEFNERFRFSDTISDAAFLAMDLDYHNRHDLARVFEEAYIAASGDAEGVRLLAFYKCYRAYVRGKVAGFKFCEPEVGAQEAQEAYFDSLRHFHLAALYAQGGWRPELIIVRGLPGTGKTTFAKAVSEAAGIPVISSDEVRKARADIKPGEHGNAGYGQGIYTAEFTEATYGALIEKGERMLLQGRCVILDATFARRAHLFAALQAARAAGADAHIIECRAGEETVRRNMAERAVAGTVSDADFGIYKKSRESFENIDRAHLTCVSHVVVKAETLLTENLRLVMEELFR